MRDRRFSLNAGIPSMQEQALRVTERLLSKRKVDPPLLNDAQVTQRRQSNTVLF